VGHYGHASTLNREREGLVQRLTKSSRFAVVRHGARQLRQGWGSAGGSRSSSAVRWSSRACTQGRRGRESAWRESAHDGDDLPGQTNGQRLGTFDKKCEAVK
jgi:hypothetical protein